MQTRTFTRSAATKPVASCIAVLAFVAGAFACSGTTTGTGTGTNGKGKGTGLFGAGNGGTSGTAGTSGSAMGAVPTSCSASAADDMCTACLKASCCSSTVQCANDPECRAVFDCAGTCTTQQCTNDCIAAHPTAQSNLMLLVNCEQQFCVAQCGSGSSNASSGGTSGSADTCLAGTPQDPSYCPNMPTRQTVKDCPNGPPSPDCVLSPTGSLNVYCCP